MRLSFGVNLWGKILLLITWDSALQMHATSHGWLARRGS